MLIKNRYFIQSYNDISGRIKQDVKEKQIALNLESIKTTTNQKPSTSLGHSQTILNKSRSQNDVIRRLDFVPESSFDSNKNYTKNINNVINGTKVSKKLSLDDESDAKKSWRTHPRNGVVTKSKRRGNLWRKGRKETDFSLNINEEREDKLIGLDSSFHKASLQDDKRGINDSDVTVENIAERIKKKKESAEKKTSKLTEVECVVSKRTATKRTLSDRRDESPAADRILLSSSQANEKSNDKCASRRTKRQRVSKLFRSSMENSVKSDIAMNPSGVTIVSGLRKSARNTTKVPSKVDDHESDDAHSKANDKFNYDSPPESCDETECIPQSSVSKLRLSDEEVIEEQQRIERLLLQEREDFELACRLQAQFDEMERIAGRTRRSRQVIESTRCAETNSCEFHVTKKICKSSGVRKTAKRNPTVNGTASTMIKKKRGRPSKRMKIALDAYENETHTR